MTKAEKARVVVEILNREYPDRQPLLNFYNPFELLIGVILSAQTTDAGVNKVTPELFRRFPNPEKLASANPSDVEDIIHSTGFYRVKAAHIIKTAAALRERHKESGESDFSLPDNMKELTALPGVGRKTANVILSHIYNRPAIIVDTHFKRVSKRMGFTRYSEPEKIEKQLTKALPKEIQSDFSMTLNLHGRKYCHARKPDCGVCPVRFYCPSKQDT